MRNTYIMINANDFTISSASRNRYLALARGLCESGQHVVWLLLGTELPDEISKDPFYARIKFYVMGSGNVWFAKSRIGMVLYRLILHGLLVSKIMHIVGSNGIAIWLDHGSGVLYRMLVLKICKRYKYRLVNEQSEYPYLGSTIRKRINQYYLMNYFIPRCDKIFVISLALRKFYCEQWGVRRNNIPVHVLPMLVEEDRYRIEVERVRFPYKDIVYTGTMYGDKDGVDYLIKAFGLIMDKVPDARLVLIGDNLRRERMNKIYEALSNISHQDRIIFTGSLGRTELIQRINQAYCLALSRPNNIQAKYGFPTKLGEYLATGRPVIVTAVGDIPFYLDDGVNAFIAEPNNIQSFADKLEECFSNEDKAIKIGQKGQETAIKFFDYRVVTRVLMEAIEEELNV